MRKDGGGKYEVLAFAAITGNLPLHSRFFAVTVWSQKSLKNKKKHQTSNTSLNLLRNCNIRERSAASPGRDAGRQRVSAWPDGLDADEAERSAANMDAPTHGGLRRDVMWAVGG